MKPLAKRAFIVTAAEYLKSGGQLVAIVPYGLIKSEKDRAVRGLLRIHYAFEVVKTYAKGGFTNCTPRTATIRLTSGVPKQIIDIQPKVVLEATGKVSDRPTMKLSIHRGKVPNNANLIKDASKPTFPFIHTTDLKGNNLQGSQRKASTDFKSFTGPAVLFPRVGRPKKEKIVLILDSSSFVLSECVFIIECISQKDAVFVYETLMQQWDSFEALYGGTCASYISISELTNYLLECGFSVIKNRKSVRALSQTAISFEEIIPLELASC